MIVTSETERGKMARCFSDRFRRSSHPFGY